MTKLFKANLIDSIFCLQTHLCQYKSKYESIFLRKSNFTDLLLTWFHNSWIEKTLSSCTKFNLYAREALAEEIESGDSKLSWLIRKTSREIMYFILFISDDKRISKNFCVFLLKVKGVSHKNTNCLFTICEQYYYI